MVSHPCRLSQRAATTLIERLSATCALREDRAARGRKSAVGAASVVFGMRGQVQPSSQPPPAGENNDLSDSEKEDEEEVKVVQAANCYTNGSFFLESKNKLTQWLSQTDMVEEVEKVIFVVQDALALPMAICQDAFGIAIT